MIFFTTGNGSITNFPYVPTIKIMNTTRRYELLSREMDVNAGAYLEGVPIEELGKSMFELALAVASGQRSKGELAGHAQTSIWRNWRQTDAHRLEKLLNAPLPSGRSIPIRSGKLSITPTFEALRSNGHTVSDQIGLILPTSLCSGQIARMGAERLNQLQLGRPHLSRFVSLVHTEGCGVSGGPTEELYSRTMMGYLMHPLVKFALLLEHGCEKTHNDFMKHRADELGLDVSRFGFASVQLDGGIEKVLKKIEEWFRAAVSSAAVPKVEQVGLGYLRLGLLAREPIAEELATNLARLSGWIVGAGGTVVLPSNSPLLSSSSAYRDATVGSASPEPSLAYGQKANKPGFHVMETPTDHWVETLTGIGATGVEVLLAHVGERPMQGHPLVPMLQVSCGGAAQQYAEDLDLVLRGQSEAWADDILQRVLEVASRRYLPKVWSLGNNDFQMTRGLLGVSM
jgi:altronate dehydratase